jgi:hypothetical protein
MFCYEYTVTVLDCLMWILFKMGLSYSQIFTTAVRFGSQLCKHTEVIPQRIVVL